MARGTAEPGAADSAEAVDYQRLYDEQVRAALPFAGADVIDLIGETFGDAGFVDVRVTPLREIEKILRTSLRDATWVRPQFMISGRLSSELPGSHRQGTRGRRGCAYARGSGGFRRGFMVSILVACMGLAACGEDADNAPVVVRPRAAGRV